MAPKPPLDAFLKSPILVRTVPFVVFLLLTGLQGKFGESSRYWLYLIKTIVGAGLLLWVAGAIAELEWRASKEAFAVGLGVFLLWVGLDGLYPRLDEVMRDYLCPLLKTVGLEAWCPKDKPPERPWNPFVAFGDGGLAWLFVMVRLVGSTLVVPPLEEIFYRSFLYRYLVSPDFERVPFGKVVVWSFCAVAVIFGLTHREWLAGILCGLAYQALVCFKKRLGDAVVAHATTNLLLGIYILWRGAWSFW